jgi:hypothetical protein
LLLLVLAAPLLRLRVLGRSDLGRRFGRGRLLRLSSFLLLLLQACHEYYDDNDYDYHCQ